MKNVESITSDEELQQVLKSYFDDSDMYEKSRKSRVSGIDKSATVLCDDLSLLQNMLNKKDISDLYLRVVVTRVNTARSRIVSRSENLCSSVEAMLDKCDVVSNQISQYAYQTGDLRLYAILDVLRKQSSDLVNDYTHCRDVSDMYSASSELSSLLGSLSDGVTLDVSYDMNDQVSEYILVTENVVDLFDGDSGLLDNLKSVVVSVDDAGIMLNDLKSLLSAAYDKQVVVNDEM